MNSYFTKRNGELLAYLNEVAWEAEVYGDDVLNDLSTEDYNHPNVSHVGIETIFDDKFREVHTKEMGTKEEIQNFIDLTVAINKVELLLG